MNQNQSKKLARKLIEGFRKPVDHLTHAQKEFPTAKKAAKAHIEYCKKHSTLSFLEDRKRNSSKWEIIWGEWSLGTKRYDSEKEAYYGEVFFDLVVQLPDTSIDKVFYIILSNHALERILQRGELSCTTPHELRSYLDTIIKKLALRCLMILEENQTNINAEGHEVFDDIFAPIAMNTRRNTRGQIIRAFTIKTIMKVSELSKKKSKEIVQNKTKSSLFDYENLLILKILSPHEIAMEKVIQRKNKHK